MAETTGISWTHATFSPWIGCQKVGPGCDSCYAEAWDNRFGGQHWGPGADRRTMSEAYWQKPILWNKKAALRGEPFRVFPSMCDPFDNAAPEGARVRFGRLIVATPNITWMLLTKRIGNAAKMLAEMFPEGVPANVWIGATVVNQDEAYRDIPLLRYLKVCARISRVFISYEPALGPLDLTLPDRLQPEKCLLQDIDVIFVGGESGPGARPAHPDWFRSLRDQCERYADAGGPIFHFKQWGEWVSVSEVAGKGGEAFYHFPDGATVRRVGTKAAGHTLDGKVYQDMPE